MKSSKYNNIEIQIVMLARQIKDGQAIIVGTGLPLIGAVLAKNYYATNCHLIVETAIMDSCPHETPTSVGDVRFMKGASTLWEQYRYFGLQSNTLKNNIFDLGIIGGAQMDPFGNLNSTVIGDYDRPKVRFTGSGGANGIATFVNTIIMIQHEKRRFVEKIDYLTSPGWLDGPEGRKKAGLPANRGPQAVVTDLALLKFDSQTKRVYVSEYYPGVDLNEIIDKTGFEIDISRAIQAEEPEKEALEILRNQVDPTGEFIGRN